MLQWRPANSKLAILAVQHVIASQPYHVDAKRLFYYVTLPEVAKEFRIDPQRATLDTISELFRKAGLEPRQVHPHKIPGSGTYGFFVSEEALKRAGINLPPWECRAMPERAPRDR